MRLEREYHIEQPLNLVWDSILDPDLLAEILPGCKSLNSISDTKFEAEVEIKIGPVKSAFNSQLEISNVRPNEGYHFEMSGIGKKGHMSGSGDISLEEKEEVKGRTLIALAVKIGPARLIDNCIIGD